MPEALSLRLIDDLLRTKEPLQIPFTEKKTNIMNIKRFSDLLTYSLNLISLFVGECYTFLFPYSFQGELVVQFCGCCRCNGGRGTMFSSVFRSDVG